MTNKIGLFDSLENDFYIGNVQARIYLGKKLVYPMDEEDDPDVPLYPFTFYRESKNGSGFTVECGERESIYNTQTNSGLTNSQVSGNTDVSPSKVIFGDCCKTITNSACTNFQYATSIAFGRNIKEVSGYSLRGFGIKSSTPITFDFSHCRGGVTFDDSIFGYMNGQYNTYKLPKKSQILSYSSGAAGFLYQSNIESLEFGEDFKIGDGYNWYVTATGRYIYYGHFHDSKINNIDLNGVTTIGVNAFSYVTFKNNMITIPKSVTTLGNRSFINSTGITAVKIESEIPPLNGGTNLFANVNIIYVPCGSEELYKTSTNYTSVANKIEGYNFENPLINCNGEATRDDDDDLIEDLSLRRLKSVIAMTTKNGNDNHIVAEDGKVFRRKSDGFIYGNEIHLGFTYYIGGKLLDEPRLEVPEDFEEIDEPKNEENDGKE